MIDYTFKIRKRQLPENLVFELPHNLMEIVSFFVEKANTDYFRVRITKPSRKRTRPQQGIFHSMIQQISVETGNSFDIVKMYVKTEAIGKGYGFETLKGKVYPKSEALASVEEENILIDQAQQLADELRIKLREDE